MRLAGLLSERFDPFGAVRAGIVLFSVRLLFCSWRETGKSGDSLRFSRRWYALSGVGVIIGLYGVATRSRHAARQRAPWSLRVENECPCMHSHACQFPRAAAMSSAREA